MVLLCESKRQENKACTIPNRATLFPVALYNHGENTHGKMWEDTAEGGCWLAGRVRRKRRKKSLEQKGWGILKILKNLKPAPEHLSSPLSSPKESPGTLDVT